MKWVNGYNVFGLIELDNNFNFFFFDAFGGRNGQFFSLFASLAIFAASLFSFGGAVSVVHVFFDGIIIGLNVVNDFVFDGPFKEVELADGGFNKGAVFIRDINAVPAAEGVESFFAVCF